MRRTALDLCCCEGGATAGYRSAGFKVTGIDKVAWPNYPGDEFVQGDAIAYLWEHGHRYDAVFGSPPCLLHSTLNAYNGKVYDDLIDAMRDGMIASGRPWVIENVPTAPLRDPVVLCGSHFGLNMKRHRHFETGGGFTFAAPWVCPNNNAAHKPCVRNGYLPTAERPWMSIHGGKHSAAWLDRARHEMGMPWASSVESVCQAIPPVYAEYIGRATIDHLDAL